MEHKDIFKKSLESSKKLVKSLTKKQLLDLMKVFDDYEVEQSLLFGVGSSLKKKCKELNLDPEDVLLEYCDKENILEIFYDEGIEETYLVNKGFISL